MQIVEANRCKQVRVLPEAPGRIAQSLKCKASAQSMAWKPTLRTYMSLTVGGLTSKNVASNVLRSVCAEDFLTKQQQQQQQQQRREKDQEETN